ncbi:hypothetical protein [Halpernia sp. GG3]
MVTGSWSWNGFAKSLLVGAITGGLGGVFLGIYSATGFNGAVVLGSMYGAIGGGVEAIFSGQNFFKGLYSGAVVGAAFGGIGFAINYLACGGYKSYYSMDNNANSDYKYDPSISDTTMNKNINTTRTDNFNGDEINKFGVGNEYVGQPTLDGHLQIGNEKSVLGWTKPMNIITGKSDIVYAPLTAQNNVLLGKVMVHETAHAFSQKSFLFSVILKSQYDNRLNSTDHLAIYNLENLYGAKQGYFKNGVVDILKIKGVFLDDINDTYGVLNSFQKFFYKKAYEKFYPIFNRFMILK